MKIRRKLLLLLLAIALVPLGISAAWHHLSLYRLDSHLAVETHKHLSETALFEELQLPEPGHYHFVVGTKQPDGKNASLNMTTN